MPNSEIPLVLGAVPRTTFDAVLRQDFFSFFQAAFPIVAPGVPLQGNWHLPAICYALERVLRGEIKRLIITLPPRSLKSLITSVAFPAYLLGRKPTSRIICVSYAADLARKHADDCRRLMRSRPYQRLYPGTCIDPRCDTQFEIGTTQQGFRLATSVGGVLTGRGGNLIVVDDPIKPSDAHSDTIRADVNEWFGQTLISRLDNKAEDAIIVVMQRLHVDDLVGMLLEQGGWEHLNLPVIAMVEETIPLSPTRCYVRRPGDLLHPEREPQSVLDNLRRHMGSADFSAQYLQEPVPAGGHMIKWDWFQTHEKPPAIESGDRIIMSWDTAMTAHELSDYSACVVLLVRGERVWVLDVVRERLESPDLLRRVIREHYRWRATTGNYALLIENRGSGIGLIQHLRREGVHAIAAEPEGDKVMRMDAQLPMIEARTVSLPARAPWLDEFRKEILSFPRGSHDDQVDALSQALKRAFTPSPGIIARPVRGMY